MVNTWQMATTALPTHLHYTACSSFRLAFVNDAAI